MKRAIKSIRWELQGLALGLFVIWGIGCTIGARGAEIPRAPSELRPALEGIMQEEHVPGIGVVVVLDGKVAWQGAWGSADVARKVPVLTQTRFRIGDLSHGFIGLAALQLQAQHKLKLTDTLSQWAPELAVENPWEATDPVRLMHLLEHTSGLADMGLMEYAQNVSPSISLREALKLHHEVRKARWRPGSRAAYSNVGPALLAYVIEKVTGRPFEEYVKENFFVPMGMKSASYFEPRTEFAGQYASDGVTALPYWNHLFRPCGAINASVEDMTRYLLMLVNRGSVDGVQVVTPSIVERLERPETLAMVSFGITVAPGFGMLNTIENGVHFRGHYGIVNGGLSDLLYIPETRSGVIVMINSLNPSARGRILGLFIAYLAQYGPQRTQPPEVSVDPELRNHYEGFYLEDSPSLERFRFVSNFTSLTSVAFTEKGMITRNFVSGFEQNWAAYTGRTFRLAEDPEPTVALFRAEDGAILMQSKWGTLRKVSAIRAIAPFVIGGGSVLLMLSSLLAGLVWMIRALLARQPSAVPPSLHLLPMSASALFFGICLVWAGAMNLQSLWGPWGRPTPESIAALAFGVAFLVCSVLSVVNVLHRRGVAMNRIAYWHCALASGACVTVAGYLLYWRALGVPSWWL